MSKKNLDEIDTCISQPSTHDPEEIETDTALRKLLEERWTCVLETLPPSESARRLTRVLHSLAFRDGAIAVRALIRDYRRSGERIDNLLKVIYDLAAIESLLSVVPYDPETRSPSWNVFQELQPEQWQRILQFNYDTLGYEQLPILNKTDCNWFVEAWGIPSEHCTLKKLYQNEWSEAAQRFLKKDWYTFIGLKLGTPEPSKPKLSFEDYLDIQRKIHEKFESKEIVKQFSINFEDFLKIQKITEEKLEDDRITTLTTNKIILENKEESKFASTNEFITSYCPFLKQLPDIELLYISDKEILDNFVRTVGISISISASPSGIDIDMQSNTIEPSTIFTKLPVKKPLEDVIDPGGYEPNYRLLTPEQRWKYLNWLLDVSVPISFDYVFIYYLGLERQLFFGNFEKAFAEIIKLKKHHSGKSFNSYSNSALFHACLYRKRIDKLSELRGVISDIPISVLLASCKLKVGLSPQQVIQLFNKMSGLNRKYLQDNKSYLISVLPIILKKQFDVENFPLYRLVDVENIQNRVYVLFANQTLPEEIGRLYLPDFFRDEKVISIVTELYKNACSESRALKKRG